MYDPAQLKKDADRIRKSGYFDEGWYRAMYPDVDRIGMDPAEHFSTAFFLDTHPGGWQKNTNALMRFLGKNERRMTPEERSILWSAQNVALRGEPERAAQLAADTLPARLAHTSNILQANVALRNGSEDRWLRHVNAYLDTYGIAPVTLSGSGPIFDRLSTAPVKPVTGGPLVSVIMPAWNAQNTVGSAARSILAQSWQNLELLIVDDCSEDDTWAKLQELEAEDSRVRIMRNKVNVGPYVSKNIALMQARGDWITGHDADDWAHPQRIENHIKVAIQRNLEASHTYMTRMQPCGRFGHIGRITSFSFDGVARKASISSIFKHSFLKKKLGFWDTVRFGADSEMIARTTSILGERFEVLPQISMICLDLETSLTNHPEHGVDKVTGVSPMRANYRDDWTAWHKEKMTAQNAYLEFPQKERRYKASPEMVVSNDDIKSNFGRMS